MRAQSDAGEIPLYRDVQVQRRAGRPGAAIVQGCTGVAKARDGRERLAAGAD